MTLIVCNKKLMPIKTSTKYFHLLLFSNFWSIDLPTNNLLLHHIMNISVSRLLLQHYFMRTEVYIFMSIVFIYKVTCKTKKMI